MTNARHDDALARTAELVEQLRAEIAAQLVRLVRLDDRLGTLATTRQRVGPGLVTEEGRQRANDQARLDRAAARGYHERRAPGLAFLNQAGRLGTGAVVAPATISAVSASAEIRFGVLHHLRRLTGPATRAALELTAKRPELALELLAPLPVDASLEDLADRLRYLVVGYTSRKGLEEILRDLEQLEETALTALEGPASTNHPDPCPWCGRDSLVIHHREDGRPVQVIRCEGRHECSCDFDFCPCKRNPFANRHEWTNSGRATHTWHQLHNLQTLRKEALMAEQRALDALEEIRHLHQRVDLTPAPGIVCRECSDLEALNLPPVAWPCATYRLTDLDGELDELEADDQGEEAQG